MIKVPMVRLSVVLPKNNIFAKNILLVIGYVEI